MQTQTRAGLVSSEPLLPTAPTDIAAVSDWRGGLPVMRAAGLVLRELSSADAPALAALLSVAEVARFMAAPPSTSEGFERFIAWSCAERHAGRHACFAVVLEGRDTPIGIFQIRQLTPDFTTAEWGFALGRPFWGSGVFRPAARLAIEFAFETLGVHRLEARAAVTNGRGNGALAKIGAIREGVLRRSFEKDGEYLDQAIWSIVRDEWRQAKVVWGSMIH